MPTADGQAGIDREMPADAPPTPLPDARAGKVERDGVREVRQQGRTGALVRAAGRLAVRGWGGRRSERMRRLGMFFRTQRTQNRQTLEEVVGDAERDGEPISVKQLWSIEQLANLAKASARREVSFFTVWYLAQRYGKSLGDLELYLLAGEDAAASETQAARANALRAAYLGLSPSRQRQAMEFMDFLANLDEQSRAEENAQVAQVSDEYAVSFSTEDRGRDEAARAVALADSETFLDGLAAEAREASGRHGKSTGTHDDDPGRSSGRRRRQRPTG